MNFKPRFMAMCLNGMPHREIEEACRVMIRDFAECTTVPLPTLSQRMWTENTPGLNADREKKMLYFDLRGKESELTEFYEHYLAGDLDYFAISDRFNIPLLTLAEMYRAEPWEGFKMVHFNYPGLYSWGLSTRDEKGAPALYNETLKDVMTKALAMKAKWQERKVKELFPDKDTFITVGDGALSVYSSAGGTGSWSEIMECYNELMEPLEGDTCIHCCANFDWSLLMATRTSCINFDAYQYGETLALYADQLRDFLTRGGMVAWGIVPTAGSGGDISTETPESLAARLEKVIDTVAERGIDRQQLMDASLVSPSCETGSMTLELADRVYDVTNEVSRLLRSKYFSGV
jgi:hypothetical protein